MILSFSFACYIFYGQLATVTLASITLATITLASITLATITLAKKKKEKKRDKNSFYIIYLDIKRMLSVFIGNI